MAYLMSSTRYGLGTYLPAQYHGHGVSNAGAGENGKEDSIFESGVNPQQVNGIAVDQAQKVS